MVIGHPDHLGSQLLVVDNELIPDGSGNLCRVMRDMKNDPRWKAHDRFGGFAVHYSSEQEALAVESKARGVNQQANQVPLFPGSVAYQSGINRCHCVDAAL